MRRSSSVKINIQQLHDNKAYLNSTEDIQGSSGVSQESFDVMEMVNSAGSEGEFSGENGKHSKRGNEAMVEDEGHLTKRNVNEEDNNKSVVEIPEQTEDLDHKAEVTTF